MVSKYHSSSILPQWCGRSSGFNPHRESPKWPSSAEYKPCEIYSSWSIFCAITQIGWTLVRCFKDLDNWAKTAKSIDLDYTSLYDDVNIFKSNLEEHIKDEINETSEESASELEDIDNKIGAIKEILSKRRYDLEYSDFSLLRFILNPQRFSRHRKESNYAVRNQAPNLFYGISSSGKYWAWKKRRNQGQGHSSVPV